MTLQYIKRCLLIAKSRKKLIFLWIFISIGVSAFVVSKQSRIYKTQAILFWDEGEKALSPLFNESLKSNNNRKFALSNLEQIVTFVKTPNFLITVLDAIKKETTFKESLSIETLDRLIGVTLLEKQNALALDFHAKDPLSAKTLGDVVTKTLLDYLHHVEISGLKDKKNYLQSSIKSESNKIQEIRKEIEKLNLQFDKRTPKLWFEEKTNLLFKELDTLNKLISDLMLSLEQTEIQLSHLMVSTKILTPPILPIRSHSPSRIKIFLYYLTSFLILLIIFLTVLEFIQPKFHFKEDFELMRTQALEIGNNETTVCTHILSSLQNKKNASILWIEEKQTKLYEKVVLRLNKEGYSTTAVVMNKNNIDTLAFNLIKEGPSSSENISLYVLEASVIHPVIKTLSSKCGLILYIAHQSQTSLKSFFEIKKLIKEVSHTLQQGLLIRAHTL